MRQTSTAMDNISRNFSLTFVSRILIVIGRTRRAAINLTQENNSQSKLSQQPFSCCWYIQVIFGVIIVAVNSLVISIYRKNQQLKKKASFFLLFNQACADLLTGLWFLPAYILDGYLHTGVSNYIVCFIFFNALFCRTLLALNRYFAIAKPFKYKGLMTKTRTKYLLVAAWSCSLLLTLLPLCWISEAANQQQTHGRRFKIFLWIVVVVILVAILMLYMVTFCKVRQFIRGKRTETRQKKPHARPLSTFGDVYTRKEHRLTIQFAVSTGVFIFTYLPVLYINFIGPLFGRPDLSPDFLLSFSLYTFLLNPILSPLILLCFNKEFRIPPFARVSCCCRRTQVKEIVALELK